MFSNDESMSCWNGGDMCHVGYMRKPDDLFDVIYMISTVEKSYFLRT